jgi:hypothetical protein
MNRVGQMRESTRVNKQIHVVESIYDNGLWKPIYYDPEACWLRPNLCLVNPQGELIWQSNALGLRGPDVDDNQNIGVVWGDSVVFGILQRSWPEMLNDFTRDYVFLNGGIEGIPYPKVLERAIDLNRRRPVAINVIMPGWLQIGSNSRFRNDLRTAVSMIPNAILATMPTALNAGMIREDISGLLTPQEHFEDGFCFWGGAPYSVNYQEALFAHVVERNAMIHDVAVETATPVIDLFRLLDSSELGDFRQDFFDVAHPRPSSYPKFASGSWNIIGPFLDAKESSEPIRSPR